MNALQVIKRDHETIEACWARYQGGATEDEKSEVAKELFKLLAAHERAEDKHFYHVVLGAAAAGEKAVVEECEKEQHELEAATVKAMALTIFVDLDKELVPLMERVLAHAKKEESLVFPAAEACLSPEKLEELGAQMEPDSATTSANKS